MNVAAAHFPEIGRTGAGRLVVTSMVLLAFALQSYITQTHVHRAPATADRAPIVEVVGKISAHSAAPVQDEAIACPFCQAIATAGAFFSPAGVELGSLVVPADTAILPSIDVELAIACAGFSWRSRAPPRS